MHTLVTPGSITGLVAARAGLGEEILAAGQLRQGKAPSMASMVTGIALIEVLRPRRTKRLPRNFVLAVTPTRIVALKSWGGGSEDGDDYTIHIRPGVCGQFRRDEIALTDLKDGAESKGGTLQVGSERIPVFRPNMTGGDEDTQALMALLGGL